MNKKNPYVSYICVYVTQYLKKRENCRFYVNDVTWSNEYETPFLRESPFII